MIQRIQTLWLLLAVAFAVLSYFTSFYSGVPAAMPGQNFYALTGMSNLALQMLTGLVAITSFILIFLYKNRRQQLIFTMVNFVVAVGLIFLYFGDTAVFVRGQASLDLSSIVVFLIPVMLLLAARGIYADEKLVKSLNRLR